MFARVNTITGGVQDLGQGVFFGRQQILPKLEKYLGFEGLMLLADTVEGVAFVITFWKSEEDFAASQEDAQQLIEMAARAFDVQVEVRDCEVAFSTVGLTLTD